MAIEVGPGVTADCFYQCLELAQKFSHQTTRHAKEIVVYEPPSKRTNGIWRPVPAMVWDVNRWFFIGYQKQALERGVQIFFKYRRLIHMECDGRPAGLAGVWAWLLRQHSYTEDWYPASGDPWNPAYPVSESAFGRAPRLKELRDDLKHQLEALQKQVAA